MGRSKSGGIFGFVRGKVGGKSFYVIPGRSSSSGKTEQGVRAIAEEISNPQTVAQCMQRMKLAPAQKFYKAFSELLNNAWQGVKYGDASRRHFLSKCMAVDGPYVQRGVDRFIPAAYPFSEGSLPSVGIEPFSGGAQVITLAATTTETDVTNAVLANALGVSISTQISVAVVNNVNGIFQPTYIPYSQRLTLDEIPAGTLGKDANGHITIDPSGLGLENSAMVACCVVISTQDASGNWLRSTQEMIISNELRASLYSSEALEAAIYSYQDGTNTVNSINSEWYYNLGMSQAWGGKLTSTLWQVTEEGDMAQVVVGLKQLDGRITRTIFATSLEDTGKIILVIDGAIATMDGATVEFFKSAYEDVDSGVIGLELWSDAYAAQMGFLAGEA